LPSISEIYNYTEIYNYNSSDTFNDSVTSFVSERNNDKDLTSNRKSLRKTQDDQQISMGLQRRYSSCLQVQGLF